MRNDSVTLEDGRMQGHTLDNYPWMHERHRLFPLIFEKRNHKDILDISAGIGVVAGRITAQYDCHMVCNEVDQNCVKELKKLPVELSSHDLDSGGPLPWRDGAFDAIICLATLEHLIYIDQFTKELHRILSDNGRLYFSVPNYASLYWLIPIIRGKTFHDPFDERSRYEFYAHIRYFTYHSLLEYMEHFGFSPDVVYLPLPEGSSHFQRIRRKNPIAARLIRSFFHGLYLLSPRWHQEPVICFCKTGTTKSCKIKIL